MEYKNITRQGLMGALQQSYGTLSFLRSYRSLARPCSTSLDRDNYARDARLGKLYSYILYSMKHVDKLIIKP